MFNENDVLEGLVGVILGTLGDHVGSCRSLEAPLGHLGGDLGGLGATRGPKVRARSAKMSPK